MTPQGLPAGHCLRGEEQSNGRAEPQALCKSKWETRQPNLSIYNFRERILTSGRIGRSSVLTAQKLS